MATVSEIIVLISAVIAAAFLMYFAYMLVIHKREKHTICMAWVGISLFLALFMRLLSISTPRFAVYSDLFLLVTVISVILLTIHMRKGFCSYCKDAKEPWETTKATLHKLSGIKRGR